MNLQKTVFEHCLVIAEGIVRKRIRNPTQQMINNHALGMLGEMVYSNYVSKLPNMRVQSSGDGGVDFNLGDKVQVKTTNILKAGLLIENKNVDKSNIDYYVLVGIDLFKRTGKLLGYISVKDLEANKYDKTFGKNIREVVDVARLTPFVN